MENPILHKEVEVMEESPELAAMKKEFLEKSEKVKAGILEENGACLDLHFGDVTPEIIKSLDDGDVEMLAQIRAAETDEDFIKVGEALNRYVRDSRQEAKPNLIISVFWREFYSRVPKHILDILISKKAA